jgi:hypothetical protein
VTTTEDTTVVDLAKLMISHHISSVPVGDRDGRVVGIDVDMVINRARPAGAATQHRATWSAYWGKFSTSDCGEPSVSELTALPDCSLQCPPSTGLQLIMEKRTDVLTCRQPKELISVAVNSLTDHSTPETVRDCVNEFETAKFRCGVQACLQPDRIHNEAKLLQTIQ